MFKNYLKFLLPLMVCCEKYGRDRQVTDDNRIWLRLPTHTHIYTHKLRVSNSYLLLSSYNIYTNPNTFILYVLRTLSAFPFIGSLLPACYVSYGGVAKLFCHLTPTRCLHPFRKKHTPHLSSYKPSRRIRELSDNRTRAGEKSVRILSFTFL